MMWGSEPGSWRWPLTVLMPLAMFRGFAFVAWTLIRALGFRSGDGGGPPRAARIVQG